jgi:SAM-dependent MidA family methyltransferase
MSDSELPIVGEIAPSQGAKPFWRVIRHEWDLREAPANTRPCPHPHFTLDPKYATVTCSECNERIDAFAVLMVFVERWGWIEHHRQMAEHAERRLHRAELQRLRKLRACTEAQAKEIDEMLHTESRQSPRAMEKLASRIRHEHFEQRQAKRRA